MKFLPTIFIYILPVLMFCKQQQALIDQIPSIIEKEFDISDLYQMFQPLKMSKIDIQALFKFVDINKDNKLSILEWENFYSLFLKQYIGCDSNQDFQISFDEFRNCESLQTSFQKYNIDSDQIFKVFGKKEDQNINLNNYLYVRRMIYAWQQCSNNSEIPLSQISCGIEIVAPGTTEYLNYAIDLFHQLQKLRFGMLVESKAIHINIIDFFLLSYLYSQFENYEYPCSEGILQKKEMIRSVELGKVPEHIDRKMVELMFNDKETIDFNDFSIFFYIQILFDRFSVEKIMKFDNFMAMLQDEFFPNQISKSIENVVLPSQESIEQLRTEKQVNHLLTADQYFSSFFQKNLKFSKLHKKHKQEDSLQKIGEIIFNIFKNDMHEGLKFAEFYHFYSFSIVFIIIDQNKVYSITLNQISQLLSDLSQLPIKACQEQINNMNQILLLIQESRQTMINIKQFLAESYFKVIFERVKQRVGISRQNALDEMGIKLGLNKMGMFIDEAGLRECYQGKDGSISFYNYKDVFIKSLWDENQAMMIDKANKYKQN